MHTKKAHALIALFLVLAIAACSTAGAGPSASQQTQSAQQTKEAVAAETQQVHAEETTNAMLALLTQQAQQDAATATITPDIAQVATAEAIRQATATEEARVLGATATVEAKNTQTAQLVAETTAQAKTMYNRVLELNQNNQVKTTEGTYYHLDDFDESWAQINWYQWIPTDYSPSNFVLHAYTAWKSASTTADWWSSGCGFVFREQDNDNYYMIFLALSGYVKLTRMLNGNPMMIARSYYGQVDTPNGEAEIMLVVEDKYISYFINGKRITHISDPNLKDGRLGMTLVSGTNKDFGTNCQMTDIELWELK